MFYTMLSYENLFRIVIIFTGSTAVISCEVHDIFSFAIVAFVFFRWRWHVFLICLHNQADN